MTLILSVQAEDGVVVASDGGVTFGVAWPWLLPPTQKVFLCDGCAAWGGAGSLGVIQRIGYALTLKDQHDPGWARTAVSAQDLRSRVVQVVRPVLAECLDEHLGSGDPG